MPKPTITVQTTVNLPVDQTWSYWSGPEHITQWNFAADSWHCPSATNDLKPGGRFSWRMEAKDGSMGFDYCGTYMQVDEHKLIISRLDDDREVRVEFFEQDGKTRVTETFETEDVNTLDLQRTGWQAILDNFRNYTEQNK